MSEAPQRIGWRSLGDGVMEAELSGDFRMGAGGLPSADASRPPSEGTTRIVVVDGGMEGWDTSVLALLARFRDHAETVEVSALPEALQRLHHLATVVPEYEGEGSARGRESLLERVGTRALATWREVVARLEFLGEAMGSLGRWVTGRAQYRRVDLWLTIQHCGPEALPIVTTISVLVGAILAFVGALQLRMFGAEVYVANLVGMGMVIEMGALMTGIILSGRTGAAFAAQLGTMQVNEEIDALQTMGIPPMDYLVLPRILGLAVMTPLLVLYADALGILGGAAVGILVLDIPPVLFFSQTFEMMTPWYVSQGLIKGTTFGVLIALAGCLRGMQCGRSASAVGEAATSAVVTSILSIVCADAAWTYVFVMLDLA